MRSSFLPCNVLLKDTLREVDKTEMISDKTFLESSSDWEKVYYDFLYIWHNQKTNQAVVRFESFPLVEQRKHFEFVLHKASDAQYCALFLTWMLMCVAHYELLQSEKHGTFLESMIEVWAKEREEERDTLQAIGQVS